jgi:hypothetical protein
MIQYISYSLASRNPIILLEGSIVQYSHRVWGTHATSLNEMYSEVYLGKHLCDNLCVQNGLK